MLKSTVRNLYQFMSVQAELHDPIAARWYSYNRNCAYLLVKRRGNVFDITREPDDSFGLKIFKNAYVQTYTRIPKFGETYIIKPKV